jgi:hypothetical protein
MALPNQKNYDVAYGLAFKLAADKLAGSDDLEKQCSNSDSICQVTGTSGKVLLKYLNRAYQVSLPDVSISLLNNDEKVELRDKILILHYLTGAKGSPLAGQLIAYQELQEGAAYYPTFVKRAIKPLIDHFGQSPEKLLAISKELGGYQADYGDTAVTIPAFSRVPITLVLWRGDAEFPPNANILFDSTVLDFLSAEDINVLCQTIVWQLVKMLQSVSNIS